MLFHKDTLLTDKSTTVNGIPKLNGELYFLGESHAGHYIPSMIDFILQQNDKLKDTSDATKKEWARVEIPVAGAAIGNGWVDPYHQGWIKDLFSTSKPACTWCDTVASGGEYDYDLELEMQTSGGGGSKHSSASSGYRDTPPDRMGSDISTSSTNCII
eukprot:scaffold10507_cov64-Attheya_sp.AAC.1